VTQKHAWRKSSYSGGGGNECVEVRIDGGRIAVRDSKDIRVPGLDVASNSWLALAEGLRG